MRIKYLVLCATFHQDSTIFGTKCRTCVHKHVWKEHLCALQVFLCALVSRLVSVRTRAQVRGNIVSSHMLHYNAYGFHSLSSQFAYIFCKIKISVNRTEQNKCIHMQSSHTLMSL